ncbi:unnamed protein product [Rotaria magnacalcarata]|uniref:Uncharacterized protein n=3 Tax=Rotaria magnacalcarata TaxID=392030 RepID=A0A815NAI4_9BILA|nr:unnamed protein product [Rotaria magnacalcarata]
MQNCEELTTINEHSSILPQIELNEDSASNSDIESQPEVQVLDINNKINSFPSRLKSQQSSKEKRSPGHRKKYLSSWENDPASFYLSYSYDTLGKKQVKYLCWLYKKSNENTGTDMLGCRLCEEYHMIKNKNGKENTWATKGFNVLALDKIKEHRLNEKHREAEQLEVQRTSSNQPDWISTRSNVLSRQEEAVKNLMYSCIHLCQNDHSLNSFSPLCDLLEKVGVKLLPAEVAGISYRNDNAALIFLQHIANVSHKDLLSKLKKSPVLGFMMDESTSRSIEKNCIVYVRYLENFEPRTTFYGIINMEGDGSAENIVKNLSTSWENDDLQPSRTCWLATDNASTFKGIHNGVAAKLRKHHDMPCLELNTCVAHSYALVGKQAGQYIDGNQALLALLEHTSSDLNTSQNEREAAAELLMEILDDRFLFILHFHFDIHECISGELTKMMQKDDISYKMLMDTVSAKKQMLVAWTKQSNGMCPWGPSLAEYLSLTEGGNSFGAFKVPSKASRDVLTEECCLHVQRLLEEIERRFPPSELHRCFSFLFDPLTIEENQALFNEATYGRQELQYLRQKYQNLSGFDSKNVQMEWESFKPLMVNFIGNKFSNASPAKFWKNFIELKTTTNERFSEEFKNILILLSIYLISPLNSAECERGYSAANRIQTIARSRITNETLNCLLTVRLLLGDNIRSAPCHQIVEEAFKSWNDPESSRRLNRVKLIIDVPDDYEPYRQSRSNIMKRKRLDYSTTYSANSMKPKKPKANSIKCANRCGQTISYDDPMQVNSILCCHQHEEYEWVDAEDSCRRWLCNFCRIKLAISTDTNTWFCEDHRDMHEEIEEISPAI